MLSYIARRLLLMVPTLLGITALVFFCMAYSPGGIGGPLLDQQGNLQGDEARRIREYYEHRYGLDQPKLVQYGRWLNRISPIGFEITDDQKLGEFGFKWPDLGESMARHRPVIDLIAESLPITLLLNLLTLPITYVIGVWSGILAARHRGQWFDVSSGAVMLGLWSIPVIWAGVMFIGLLANRQYISLFPTAGLHDPQAHAMNFFPGFDGSDFQRGWLLDTAWHLVGPIFCMTYGSFAFLAKLTRGSILENLSEDYVRTATAKGVSDNVILYRHVFRNSLLSLITVAAGIIPSLMVGSIIIESIFSIPGMGRLAVQAVQFRDRELVLAVTLVGGLIGLLSEIVRDVCYAVADPRVSYE